MKITSFNIKVDKDSKLFIGIGDSFCEGSGAQPIEIWEKYGWDRWKLSKSDEGSEWALKNSFVNKICERHLKDFTPVNLGSGGKGNRFAIRELFLNPTIDFKIAKEKIVVFAMSGIERLDFSNSIVSDNNGDHSTTIWSYNEEDVMKGYSSLLRPDGESINNIRFAISEFMFDMFMLTNWCELNNAKLLLFSGFTKEYNREHFNKLLIQDNGGLDIDVVMENTRLLLDRMPWDKIIKPMGYECVTDMLLHLEGRDDLVEHDTGIGSINYETIGENHYLTKCQHPSYKGHELLSDIIYEKIVEWGYI